MTGIAAKMPRLPQRSCALRLGQCEGVSGGSPARIRQLEAWEGQSRNDYALLLATHERGCVCPKHNDNYSKAQC